MGEAKALTSEPCLQDDGCLKAIVKLIAMTIEKYREALLRRLADGNNWPSFRNAEWLQFLDLLAMQPDSLNSTKDKLSSVFIYHALAEEMLKLTEERCRFYIMCCVFPDRILFPREQRKFFGQRIRDLRSGLSVGDKDLFLDSCEQLNKKRVSFAHKLTQYKKLIDVRHCIGDINSVFNNVIVNFSFVEADFYQKFYALQKQFKRKGIFRKYGIMATSIPERKWGTNVSFT